MSEEPFHGHISTAALIDTTLANVSPPSFISPGMVWPVAKSLDEVTYILFNFTTGISESNVEYGLSRQVRKEYQTFRDLIRATAPGFLPCDDCTMKRQGIQLCEKCKCENSSNMHVNVSEVIEGFHRYSTPNEREKYIRGRTTELYGRTITKWKAISMDLLHNIHLMIFEHFNVLIHKTLANIEGFEEQLAKIVRQSSQVYLEEFVAEVSLRIDWIHSCIKQPLYFPYDTESKYDYNLSLMAHFEDLDVPVDHEDKVMIMRYMTGIGSKFQTTFESYTDIIPMAIDYGLMSLVHTFQPKLLQKLIDDVKAAGLVEVSGVVL